MKRPLGYVFMVISFLLWGAVFASPFLDVSVAQAAGIAGGLYALSYVTFFVAILLLGKEAWIKLKSFFLKRFLRRVERPNIP